MVMEAWILPAYVLASAFFVESLYGTSNLDLVVDARGTRHVALSDWNGDDVYYGRCSADCGAPEGWQFVSIFDSGAAYGYQPSEVQIALDRRGRPRIAFEVDGYGLTSEGYFYAECDEDCLSRSGWRVLNFAEADQSTLSSSEWFTLAPDDSVHAVTLYTEEGFLLDQHVYLRYNVCDADCTTASSWRSIQLGYLGNLGYLAPTVNTSFAVDANKRMRLALWEDYSSGQAAFYSECSSGCEDPASWGVTEMTGRWSSAFTLRLDPAGQPHVVTYGNQTIRYLWCEGGCLTPTAWQGFEFTGLPSNAGSAGTGFTMDRQGRPHIGFATAGAGAWAIYPVNRAAMRWPTRPGGHSS